jgi:hypothetical protein
MQLYLRCSTALVSDEPRTSNVNQFSFAFVTLKSLLFYLFIVFLFVYLIYKCVCVCARACVRIEIKLFIINLFNINIKKACCNNYSFTLTVQTNHL